MNTTSRNRLSRAGMLTIAAALTLLAAHNAAAAIFVVDISPPGPGVNLGLPATHYFGDHAIGLAAPNESAVTPSPATGGVSGAGIIYDTDTKILSFEFAYGSAFGFTDLIGTWAATHIHGPVGVAFPAPNTSAGVLLDLAPFHTPAGPFSGSFSGAVPLSAAGEAMLFDNLFYINVHSAEFPAGEIRGQLIPVGLVPLPATLWMLALPLVALLRARRST